MVLAGWVRERLWRADNWPAELAKLRGLPRTVERTLDLARASDTCDPDRRNALALYVEAWRAGHPGALARARELATELRAHVTIGELALGEHQPVAAADAYLDAGLPELAYESLKQAIATRPGEGYETLFALVDHRRCDPERAIADRIAAGQFVQAVRIAKVANLSDRVGEVIAAAQRANPDDAAIARIVEARLFEANNADRMIEHYRDRFERAPDRIAYVARMRAAAVELLSRDLQPGLALRLLRMSLEQGYVTNLPEPVSHIALWEVLFVNARAQRATRELVPFLVTAMASQVSDDTAVYLARLGLEIVWRDANDTLAAQPYAATLLDYAPDQPLGLAFVREVAPESLAGQSQRIAKPLPPTVKMTPLDKTAVPTEKMPALVRPPAAITTGKIPKLEAAAAVTLPSTEQVKRSPAPPREATTGRLALLKPPTPRTTTLRRDTSPIPVAPQPAATAPARAPRAVVPIDAVVELPTGEFFTTVLRDVSASGAFIMTKRKLEPGTVVALELRIPIAGSVDQLAFRTDARIARRTEVGCGLAFVEPPEALVVSITATIG